MRYFWKIVCLVFVMTLACTQLRAEEKTIKLGTMSWEDLTPITGITKKVLEQAGYTVEVTQFSELGIAYAALTRGDVEIFTSQINYATQDYWNKNKNRLEKISPVSYGLYQAIAVPAYVNIDSLDQLNEQAAKFNGRIIGIEPGSGLMLDAENAVKAYGLKLQLVEGSTAAMTAALQSAISRNEWIAVTTFKPHWMFAKYDIKFLKDPKGIFPGAQAYYYIAHKGYSEANPHVRELLAGIYIPLDDITAINAEYNDGKTMDEAVDHWMEAHTDLVKRWMNIKKP
ncbi:glycine betaine ABC transporter substrate-binding protein [Bartonella sp. LJL80]